HGDVAHEREAVRARGEAVGVAEAQREDPEDRGGEHLADDLGRLVEAEVAGAAQLDEVVEEADDPQRGREEQHQHRRRADLLAGDHVREQVAQPYRDHDRDPAHGGGAALGLVALRAFRADLLPEALPGEEADEVRREQDGDRQCDARGDEDAPHAAPSRRAAATRSSPAAREAFTSTTSPGASSAASSAVACAASATGRPAPYSGLSTVTSSSTPSSFASSATPSWAVALSGPSSRIGPSTAQVRLPPPTAARARSAAAIESGLAL